jgi:hypothetical protein
MIGFDDSVAGNKLQMQHKPENKVTRERSMLEVSKFLIFLRTFS